MNDAALAADTVEALADGYAQIAVDFADEVDGPPTLAEFLEVLGWAIPTRSDGLDATVGEPLRMTATLTGGRRYRPPGRSRVPELNDHVFEDARSHNASLVRALAVPVTPQRFASAVLQILRTGHVGLADVDGAKLRALKAEAVTRRGIALVPGDVVAIPVESGGFRLAVFITRNRIGTALGMFEGVTRSGRLEESVIRRPRGLPVYTGENLIRNGTWAVVGHAEDLLDLFPADPEIYHRPRTASGADLGEHGAAETASGQLRMLDADEAERVGLQDGSYRQTYLAEFLQKVLSDEIG
jgi:hypothetical protein